MESRKTIEKLLQLTDSIQKASEILLEDETSPLVSIFPNVVALGKSGVGKSSILNCLVGHSLLPTGDGGVTHAPVCVDLAIDSSLCTGSMHNEDTLLVSVTPPLKLIDLPGVDTGKVDDLLIRYAKDGDTIFLVVISAVQVLEVATAEAVRTAKRFDVDSNSTVGVISKIDLAYLEPTVLAAVQDLLSNQGPPFTSGIPWVALVSGSSSSSGSVEAGISLHSVWSAENEILGNKLSGAPQTKLGRLALVEALAYTIINCMEARIPNLLSGLRFKSQLVQDELFRLDKKMVHDFESRNDVARDLCAEFQEKFLLHILTKEKLDVWQVAARFGGDFSSVMKLYLDREFDINKVKRIVSEVGCYDLYRIFNRLKPLVNEALLFVEEHSYNCVDKAYRELAESVSAAENAIQGLRKYPAFKQELLIIAATVEKFKKETECMVVGSVRSSEHAFSLSEFFIYSLQRRLDRQRLEGEVKGKPCIRRSISEGSSVTMTRTPVDPEEELGRMCEDTLGYLEVAFDRIADNVHKMLLCQVKKAGHRILKKLYVSLSGKNHKSTEMIEKLHRENVKFWKMHYVKQSHLLSELTGQLSINDNLAAETSCRGDSDDLEDDDLAVITYYKPDTFETHTMQKAFELGYAPVHLSVERLTDLIDHLLTLEATWLRRGTVQTLSCCIYLVHPHIVSSDILSRTICGAMRKNLTEILEILSDAHMEEETLEFDISHARLFSGEGVECLEMLDRCLEKVNVHVARMSNTGRDVTREKVLYSALAPRLSFLKLFTLMLKSTKRDDGVIEESSEAYNCLRSLYEIYDLGEPLNQLNSLGRPDDAIVSNTMASGYDPVGFVTVLPKAEVNTIVPEIKIFTWTEGLDYLRKTILELSNICTLNQSLRNRNILLDSFIATMDFLDPLFSASLSLVSIASLKIMLDYAKEHNLIFAIICKDARTAQMADIQELHEVQMLVKLFGDLIGILCKRDLVCQRRELGQIMEPFIKLYQKLNSTFITESKKDRRKPASKRAKGSEGQDRHQACIKLLRWVEEQIYRIALRFLLLGFLLNMYNPTGFFMLYWYMGEVLGRMSGCHIPRPGRNNEFFVYCTVVAEGLSMMFATLRNEYRVPIAINEGERFNQLFVRLNSGGILALPFSYANFRRFSHKNFSIQDIRACFKRVEDLVWADVLVGEDPYRGEVQGVKYVMKTLIAALGTFSFFHLRDLEILFGSEQSAHPYFPSVKIISH